MDSIKEEVERIIVRAMEAQRDLDERVWQERITAAEYERHKARAVQQALDDLGFLELLGRLFG